jgi:tetrahydromethanopterin S-methyltransferase subunit G
MNAALARLLHVEQVGRTAAREERQRRVALQVTFPDLAWDHFHWEQRRLTGACDRPAAAARYRDTRAAFEARYGEIVGEYWSITEPSGVALTRKKAPFVLRALVDDTRRFHRSTDWVTRRAPALADVLFGCETLAIRITEVLRYTSENVALRRILAVASHLLGVVDRGGGKVEAAEAERIASELHGELKAIDEYYRRAGVRIGRTVYTQGMVIGLFLVAALAAAFVLPLLSWNVTDWDPDLQALLISLGAGAIGGFVSVLQRMASEKFVVHYDLGKRTLYMLGSYRPVLGAVFGVFTYFLLASSLLETIPPDGDHALYYYGSLAFVAGFSERFTRVLVKGVEARTPPKDASAEP